MSLIVMTKTNWVFILKKNELTYNLPLNKTQI